MKKTYILISKKKIKPRQIIVNLLFVTMVLFYYNLIIFQEIPIANNFYVILGFITIGLISLFLLLKEANLHSYSLNLMHWFYMLIFYGIAAFYQYLTDRFLYFRDIPTSELLFAIFCILIWILFYYVGTKLHSGNKNYEKFSLLDKTVLYNERFIIFSTFISGLITIYIIRQAGISAIFSRTTAESAFSRGSIASTQLFATFTKNFVLYALVISIVNYKEKKKLLSFIILQFIFNFIVNSPFGLARYNVAIVYIGLMLTMFPSFKKNNKFLFIFFISITLVFPAINLLRNSNLFEVLQNFSLGFEEIRKDYLTGNYDAFSMIHYTYRYISMYGLKYGYQILGPLLFFVPRAIWTNKPIGSGALILETYGHDFTNGSEPLIAEGMINFGLLGVAFFALFFGYIITKLDKKYWLSTFKEKETFISVLYPFMLSSFYFMFRGDLLSTFAYMFSHFIIFYFVLTLNNKFSLIRIR